jgi:hypothetical protein
VLFEEPRLLVELLVEGARPALPALRLVGVDELDRVSGIDRILLDGMRSEQHPVEHDLPAQIRARALVTRSFLDERDDVGALAQVAHPTFGTGQERVQRRLSRESDPKRLEECALAEAVVAVDHDPAVRGRSTQRQVDARTVREALDTIQLDFMHQHRFSSVPA